MSERLNQRERILQNKDALVFNIGKTKYKGGDAEYLNIAPEGKLANFVEIKKAIPYVKV